MIKTITYTVDEYPLLTLEILASLERRVDAMKATKADCEFIDHYLTSIGKAGLLMDLLQNEHIYSFDEVEEVLKDPECDVNVFDDHYNGGRPSYGITGYLLGCVHILQRRVKRGDKIY
jgi:hypothetical protein